jgi:hypothetical protein
MSLRWFDPNIDLCNDIEHTKMQLRLINETEEKNVAIIFETFMCNLCEYDKSPKYCASSKSKVSMSTERSMKMLLSNDKY